MESAELHPPSPILPRLPELNDHTLLTRIYNPFHRADLVELGRKTLEYAVTLAIVKREAEPNAALRIPEMRDYLLGTRFISQLATFYQIGSPSVVPAGGIAPTDDEGREWAFHAYVGAVHNEHGLVNTLGWITGLYASYVISSYPIFSTSRPGNMANTNQPHNRSEESQTLASPTSAPPFQPTFGSLQQLNEILVQQKVLHRLEWTAINAALSHAPRWRLEAIFLCKDDQKRIIGCGVDTRKQNAKWAAAVQALEWLLQHGEISPKLPDE